jgi:hypothetical protein
VIEGADCWRKAFRLNLASAWMVLLASRNCRIHGRQVRRGRPNIAARGHAPVGSQRILAASPAQLGRMEEARMEAVHFLAAHAHFSIQRWADIQPFHREADRRHFVDFKAGLPKWV